jgi:hypothetical protein
MYGVGVRLISRPEGNEKQGLLPSDAPDEMRWDDVTPLEMSNYDLLSLTSKTWGQATCRVLAASRSASQKARLSQPTAGWW